MTDEPTHALLQLSDGTLVCTPRATRPVEPSKEIFLGAASQCEAWLRRSRKAFQRSRDLIAQMRDYVPHPDRARRVAFIKLRKTGGTSFASCVLFPYCVKHRLPYMVPASFPEWGISPANFSTGVQPADFHMLFRHFPDYPLRREWLDNCLGNPKKVTIVREPVSRAISMYRHLRHHDAYSKSFSEYLDSYSWNHQSTWLGFTGSEESLNGLDVIGVCERFNESMLLFARALKLELHELLYVRQRDLRGEPVEVNEADVERIREGDALDRHLHALATTKLEKTLSESPGAADELADYEAALGDFTHPLWRRRGPFKIGYLEGGEWAEVTADGEYRQLKKLMG